MSKRGKKQFHILAKQLDNELQKQEDLFFAQRPFLEDKTLEPEILALTDEQIEEKIQTAFTIKEITKKLTEL